MVGYPRVPAGRLVVERSRRRSRGPARHQAPCRHSRVAAAPKNACALDGFGCPTEAPYGCFLPDLTRFGTCRHPNPSNALGARYILPAPARWGKVANLGRGFFDFFDYLGNQIDRWSNKPRPKKTGLLPCHKRGLSTTFKPRGSTIAGFFKNRQAVYLRFYFRIFRDGRGCSAKRSRWPHFVASGPARDPRQSASDSHSRSCGGIRTELAP